MTNDQDEGRPGLRIEVTVDARAGWASIDPPRTRIRQGGRVTWVFAGVPENLRPALLFESFVPRLDDSMGSTDPFQGPFSRLTREGDTIRGDGTAGPDGEYWYKVCLVADDPANPLVRRLECRGVPAGGLVKDPGPRSG